MIKSIIGLIFSISHLSAAEVKEMNFNLSQDVILEISFICPGTRSEGQIGKLFVNGKEEMGKIDEFRTYGDKVIKWYGEKRQFDWDISGWNFSDNKLILHSWDYRPKNEIAPNESLHRTAK